jgi:hypothetical protein
LERAGERTAEKAGERTAERLYKFKQTRIIPSKTPPENSFQAALLTWFIELYNSVAKPKRNP